VSFAPGTRFGQIGAGGMGEVYRATDTNLKRTVAIKVLPEAMATDGERLVRFQPRADEVTERGVSQANARFVTMRREAMSALAVASVVRSAFIETRCSATASLPSVGIRF
jgi:serine/threonine protein kinase